MLVRCEIKRVTRGYYKGKHVGTGKRVKIVRNSNIPKLRAGEDFEFYCRMEVGLFRDIIVPISETEELEGVHD